MRRFPWILAGILLVILSLPLGVATFFHAKVIAPLSFLHVRPKKHKQTESTRLRLENERLKAQVDFLASIDRYRELLADQFHELPNLYTATDPYLQRRGKALAKLLSYELRAMPARVVYRPANTWTSSVWIDVGSRDNQTLKEEVIALNSPVVVEDSIIGIIDHVDVHRSRVRLISDSSLHPAVRVTRGRRQDRELLTHILAVQEALASREDLFADREATHILSSNLTLLKERLDPEGLGEYLAKGEMHGAAKRQWRRASVLLQGEGFNYDYTDSEGPARDLRTPSLVKAGDLLVTSGLDGVFPEGLAVARVTHVDALCEGDICYTLQAAPTAGDLNQIHHVFVLPPNQR